VRYLLLPVPLLLDFKPRFWHSLCTYALSTEVNDEGNSKSEIKRKNMMLWKLLTGIYNLKETQL